MQNVWQRNLKHNLIGARWRQKGHEYCTPRFK
jgi:hypothetical protein